MKKKAKSLGKKAMKRTKGGANPGPGLAPYKHKVPNVAGGEAGNLPPVFKSK